MLIVSDKSALRRCLFHFVLPSNLVKQVTKCLAPKAVVVSHIAGEILAHCFPVGSSIISNALLGVPWINQRRLLLLP